MVEPLPCPFCESTNVAVDPDMESVVCHKCGAIGPSMLQAKPQPNYETDEEMEDDAIEAWNKRSLARENEMLRGLLANVMDDVRIGDGNLSSVTAQLAKTIDAALKGSMGRFSG